MTLTQLEYIVAVDVHRHFAEAAESCFITQPTLSMQIQKLEEELGVKIFDRSLQPVAPTEAGIEILEHARKILSERDALSEMISEKKGVVNGELKVGIIPTLAPYLLPLFIKSFTSKHPKVRLQVTEYTTENIISHLRKGYLDVGILVTPLNEPTIKEIPLFYEEMIVYVSKESALDKKSYLMPKDLDPARLWLLEEGHCFRSQTLQVCELRKAGTENGHFEYEASSLETLRRMVDLYEGITILPELATLDLTSEQLDNIRHFQPPAPVREVSMVTNKSFTKRKLTDILKNEILAAIPKNIALNTKAKIVPL